MRFGVGVFFQRETGHPLHVQRHAVTAGTGEKPLSDGMLRKKISPNPCTNGLARGSTAFDFSQERFNLLLGRCDLVSCDRSPQLTELVSRHLPFGLENSTNVNWFSRLDHSQFSPFRGGTGSGDGSSHSTNRSSLPSGTVHARSIQPGVRHETQIGPLAASRLSKLSQMRILIQIELAVFSA